MAKQLLVLRTLIVAAGAFLYIANAPSAAHACPSDLPCNFTVEAGSVIGIDASVPNLLTIMAADKTVLSGAFSIAADTRVRIELPNADSSLLWRDASGSVSTILGDFYSNGAFFLENLNGITIGSDAHIQAAHFIASTLHVENAMFLAGEMTFSSTGSSGTISNDGSIEVSDGGTVALLSRQVTNSGRITADLGHVVLGAAEQASLSFSPEGFVNFVIEKPLASRLSAQAPVTNTADGHIRSLGGRVTLAAEDMSGVMDRVINNEGVIEASRLVARDGVIELVSSSSPVASSGELTGSRIRVDGNGVILSGEMNGSAEVLSAGDIQVPLDLTVQGDLSLTADSDRNGQGAIVQAASAVINVSGDLNLSASGTSSLSDLTVGGDLLLTARTPGAAYLQFLGSRIQASSLTITEGTTLQAPGLPSVPSPGMPLEYSSLILLSRNWTNQGSFVAGDSRVELTSTETSTVSGSNTFHDFYVLTPEKTVKFQSGTTQNFEGALVLQGSYGKLLNIKSTQSGTPWMIGQVDTSDIKFASLQDTIYVYAHGPPVLAQTSQNLGGNAGILFQSLAFTGASSSLFSDPSNWSGGFIPGSYDSVSLDASSGALVLIDPSFSGEINSITMTPSFNGTLTLQRDLKVRGDWNRQGGSFDPANFTVEFIDVAQKTHIYGNNTFYGFKVVTPDKEIYWDAGRTFAFTGPIQIVGARDQGPQEFFIKFRSTVTDVQYHLDLGPESTHPGRLMIERLNIRDAHFVHYIFIKVGVDAGNNSNALIDPAFDGGSADDSCGYGEGGHCWSDADNWDGNSVPTGTQLVEFDDDDSNNNVYIDNLGSWSGGDILMEYGYTGTITMQTHVTAADFTMRGGTFNTNGFNFASTYLSILAGAGSDGVDGNAGASGAAGNSAVFSGGAGTIDVTNHLIITSGNGGQGGDADAFGTGGIGGDGGAATFTPGSGTVTIGGNVTVTGGTSGPGGNTNADPYNEGAAGGAGGTATFNGGGGNVTVITGNISVLAGSAAASPGANYGRSGTGGDAAYASGTSTDVTTVTVTGGAASNGDGSNIGSNGGAATLNVNGTFEASGNLTLTGGAGGSGSIGGPGANGTDASEFGGGSDGSAGAAGANGGGGGNALMNSGSHTVTITGNVQVTGGAGGVGGTGGPGGNGGAGYTGANQNGGNGGAGGSAGNAGNGGYSQVTATGNFTIDGTLTVTGGSGTAGGIGGTAGGGGTGGNGHTNGSGQGASGGNGQTGGVGGTGGGAIFTFNGASGKTLDIAGNTSIAAGASAVGGAGQTGGNGGTSGNSTTDGVGGFFAGASGGQGGAAGSGGASGSGGAATFSAPSGNANSSILLGGNLTLTATNGRNSGNGGAGGTGGTGGNAVDDGFGGGINGTTGGNANSGGGGGTGAEGAAAVFNSAAIPVAVTGNVTFTTGSAGSAGSAGSDGVSGIPGSDANGYTGGTGGAGGSGGAAGATFGAAGAATLTGSSNIFSVAGNWTAAGTFGHNNGTVTLNGSADQTMTTDSLKVFFNLTLNNTGAGGSDDIILSGALDVNGAFTITNGDLDLSTNDPSVTVAGNFIVGASGSMDTASYSGTVTLDGVADQTLTSNGQSFNNLTINNAGAGGSDDIIVTDALDVNGNFTITNGDLDVSTNDPNVTIAGNLSIGASGSMDTSAYSGTFTFDGASGTKTITTNSQSFNNVVFNDGGGSATFELQSALDVNGNLTITGGTLDVKSGSNFAITLAGNWTNSDTFTARSGTVTLDGTADQTITTAGQVFNNLTLNNTGAGGSDDIVISGALDVNGTLTITDGDLDISTNDPNVNTGGDVTIGANGTIDNSAYSGTWTYDKAGTQTLTDNTASGTNFRSITINGSSTVLQLAGSAPELIFTAVTIGADDTFAVQAETVDYNGSISLTQGTISFTTGNMKVSGNWSESGGTFTPSSGTVTMDGTSGTITITSGGSPFNNLILDDAGGSATFELQDALDVNGNLTITGGTLDVKSGSNFAITLAGNWTNNDTFTARSGTVTFDGTGGTTQTLAGATTFFNFTKTEAADDGADETLRFTAGQTFTITGTLTLNGRDASDRINITSTGAAATIDLNGASSGFTGDFLDIQFSTVTDTSSPVSLPLDPADSVDNGNNTGWFPSGSTITGIVYSDEGSTALVGVTVAISIGGGAATNAGSVTDGSGNYSVDLESEVVSGDILTIFINGNSATNRGVTVTISDGATFSGLNIFKDRLIVRHEAAGPVTNTTLNTASNGDTDVTSVYSISGGNLTVAGTYELFINDTGGDDTFTPGGNVIAPSIDINGIFSPEANTVTINTAGWDATGGTFTAGTSTVNMTGDAASTRTIISNNSSFATLTLNGASSWSLSDALTVTTALNITAGGMYQTTSNVTTAAVTIGSNGSWINNSTGDITLSGNVANSGLIMFNGGGTGFGTDEIVITSSGGTRTWSGTGVFMITDVDVSDQTDASADLVTVYSSTNTSGNGWTFSGSNIQGILWDNGGGDNLTGTDNNWSGNTAPTANDLVIFNDTSDSDADVDETLTAYGVRIAYEYTSEFLRGDGIAVTLGSGGFSQKNGPFNLIRWLAVADPVTGLGSYYNGDGDRVTTYMPDGPGEFAYIRMVFTGFTNVPESATGIREDDSEESISLSLVLGAYVSGSGVGEGFGGFGSFDAGPEPEPMADLNEVVNAFSMSEWASPEAFEPFVMDPFALDIPGPELKKPL